MGEFLLKSELCFEFISCITLNIYMQRKFYRLINTHSLINFKRITVSDKHVKKMKM